MRYSVNRRCFLTNGKAAEILGYMPAGLVVQANPTYRADALTRLGVHSDDEFPIVRAAGGPILSGWLPSDDFLRTLYDEVIDHSKTSTDDLWYHRFLWSMADGLLSAFEHMGDWDGSLKLLDFGCGYGVFARLVACRGVIAVGYEPSAPRHVSAEAEVLNDLQEVSNRGPFDLLVCTEVLEHMAQPREALNSCGTTPNLKRCCSSRFRCARSILLGPLLTDLRAESRNHWCSIPGST